MNKYNLYKLVTLIFFSVLSLEVLSEEKNSNYILFENGSNNLTPDSIKKLENYSKYLKKK